MRPQLAKDQVMVQHNHGEGTPRLVLEAMAMGKAVVMTRVSGCKETVVDGQTGFLVPPKDPVALAKAMGRFQADPALAQRIGTAARIYAEANYDVTRST